MSRKLGLAALALYCSVAAAQMPHTHQHSFSNAEMWSKYFDDPKRDATQKPHEVIQALGLKPDFVVADIGSGTGYFSVRLAHMLPKGRVYGVDTEPDMVKFLADRAKRDKLDNVIAVAGAPGDPKLPEKVDLMLMVDVLHHIADRPGYLAKLKTYLKPGGRIAIIDFTATSKVGPPVAERIPADRVREDFARAGFAPASEYGFLPDQYFLVFALRHP